jgi:hypothetical protein
MSKGLSRMRNDKELLAPGALAREEDIGFFIFKYCPFCGGRTD